jgi:DNA polymerase/3'-5' exonuclease PolX
VSTTTTKRTWQQAQEDAEAFRDLFPSSTYERWEIAGSVRRRKPEVGDVEHVCIPAWGEMDTGLGLFGQKERVNLLNFHMDGLLRAGTIDKHWYGNGHRWGEKYRGCSWRGFAHEVFQADYDNFGAVLLIRTGPADFSERIVSRFKEGGILRQQDGYLRNVASGEIVPVRDEVAYFKLAGLQYIEPERRV